MGLFDAFKTGNPDTDAQINRGLLMAGLQLMQARGRLFPAIGQAGMAGVVGADQARQMQAQRDERQIRQQLGRLQVAQAQRAEDLAALPMKHYRPPSAPAVDATGGVETAVEAPNNASSSGGLDQMAYYRALQGMAPALAEQYKRMITPEAPKPMALGKDQRLVLPTGHEVVPALPADAEEKDAFVRMMRAAGISPDSEQGRRLMANYLNKQATHAPPVSIQNYGSPLPIQLPGGGEGYIQPPTRPGGPSQILTIPGTDKPAQKPGGNLTEGQAKANLFGTRAQEANKIIATLASRGVVAPSLPQQLTGGEGMTGTLATALATPEQQQVDQAQRDFINATLRRESGAVISPQEFTNARKQYFVQPGDSPQVIAQKARNRELAIAGILAEVPEAKRGVGAPAASDGPVRRYNPATGKIE